jgi:cytochrome c oxidase subunit 2
MNAGDPTQASHGFRLLAESASTAAPRTDALFTSMLVLCGVVALLLAGTMVFFAIRYREGSSANRDDPPIKGLGLEVTWTLVPLAIFIGLFGWAAYDFVQLYRVPANALPIYVVGKQWMWKLQHGNGKREINELHVPVGQPVQLIMSSQDVIHSFYVPAFRIKQDVVPGRYTSLWFQATEAGDYHLFCAEYCGTAHADMIGHVVAMPPADYARWLGSGTAQPSLARQGLRLFRELGCSGCHMPGSTIEAPMIQGLIGRTVHLQDGRSLIADENYVRDSVLLPLKDIVAGYQPVMPSFKGQVSEEDLMALIAYVKSDPLTDASSPELKP